MRRIRIERPEERVSTDVRVFIDDYDISNCVQAVSLAMEVGEPEAVNLRLIGDVEIESFTKEDWAARYKA